MKKIVIFMMAVPMMALAAAAAFALDKIDLGGEAPATEVADKFVTGRGAVYVGLPEEELSTIFANRDRVLIPHKIVDQGWVVFRNIASSNPNDVVTFYITDGKVAGWKKMFDHAPRNKGSAYELTGVENIRVWFFPNEKARWDGWKVTLLDWNKLVEVQKILFIKEYVGMLNKKFNKDTTIDIDRYIMGMNFYSDNCPEKCRYVAAAEALDQLLISDGRAEAIEDIK